MTGCGSEVDTIEIEFCLPCGPLDPAQRTRKTLLEAPGERLGGVRPKPGHGGVLIMRIDGEVVFDAAADDSDDDALVPRASDRSAEVGEA